MNNEIIQLSKKEYDNLIEKAGYWDALLEASKEPLYVPDPYMKAFTQRYLPHSIESGGFWVSDIDQVYRTILGCVRIIEVKRKGAKPALWQIKQNLMLAEALNSCIDSPIYNEIFATKTNKKGWFTNVRKVDFMILVFENTTFEDGKSFISFDGKNYKETSKEEYIALMRYDGICSTCFPIEKCNCGRLIN